MQQPICHHISNLSQEIAKAVTQCQRPTGSVKLLAVSKTRPLDEIRIAASCGHTCFGENYAQELAQKSQALDVAGLEWHFIGPLQSNKTRLVAEHAHWMHSIDRLKIAQRLSHQRPSHLPPLQICLQVNIDNEPSKSGLSLEEIAPLANAVHDLPNITLRGLMCLPLRASNIEQQRASFTKLRQAYNELQEKGYSLDTLSMGMSNDFVTAIEEGSTMVRIGTAIFGSRA